MRPLLSDTFMNKCDGMAAMECGIDLTTSSSTTMVTTPTISSGSIRKTRKRGISAVLMDSTNTVTEPSKRVSKERALSSLRDINTPTQAPRGAAKKAGLASVKVRVTSDPPALEDSASGLSLCQIVRHNTVVYNSAKGAIQRHIEKNTSLDLKKAIAIQIFVTARQVG